MIEPDSDVYLYSVGKDTTEPVPAPPNPRRLLDEVRAERDAWKADCEALLAGSLTDANVRLLAERDAALAESLKLNDKLMDMEADYKSACRRVDAALERARKAEQYEAGWPNLCAINERQANQIWAANERAVAAEADADRAKKIVLSLAGSGVIGLNDDGSVWVFGGLPASGSLTYTHGGKDALAPVWKKGEQYATADSPHAEALTRILGAAVAARTKEGE